MSAWIGEFSVRQLADGKRCVLRASFGFISSWFGRAFHIPEGFITDLTSGGIGEGKHTPAAVLHDWVYWQQELTREQADQVYLEAMIYSTVGVIRRQAYYRTVRAFGWIAWRNNARAKERGESRMYDPARDAFLAVLRPGWDGEGVA